MTTNLEPMRKHEIPGRVAVAAGNGGLAKIIVTTKCSTAEIYLHGAHVTGFQKNGEPPLLFMSAKSWFAPGKPIRGGVPVCFPWFGGREGEPAHGFARILPWELVKTSAAKDGAVTVRLRLPKEFLKPGWSALGTEFVVTVADTLTMELVATNESADKTLEIENCLHTYFHVGDINQVSLAGLWDAPFDDFAAGAAGARKVENDTVLHITKETNRVYTDAAGTVEIRDASFQRTIRVEKFNSNSTVVWNPWTTQKLPDDFDPAEHRHMVCVESGNVKQNKILLAPGKTGALKVVLSTGPL
ncbi:MAG TPA: D-hexose-6-phosphate mutarotase [Candidatus Limnocylindrales bacterium]|nr:D-hexose-6-phosphate mutarotase [Candidatus Limnocylindrales bacterium]